jgi:hypothetical protein
MQMRVPVTRNKRWFKFGIVAMLVLFSFFISNGQDAREALGPKDTAKGKLVTGTHPITSLMTNLKSTLRTELRGKHPRVYLTSEALVQLRKRATTTHQEMWQQALSKVRALKSEPPPAPAQERRAQNGVGIAIAEAALAYKIENDPKYLIAAKRYMDAAVSYEVWGYTYNKPNVDLAAGHLLYGMGWGYDLLYHDLTEQERNIYRNKLIKQARILANYYNPKPGRTYAYSQNHVFIPMAGLAVTGYALYDEAKEAPEWALLARAMYERFLATYSTDGYYYEGFEYWIFSTPWVVHYLDAHVHSTGEDLYDHPGLRQTHLYVAHSLLPNGQNIFDFGDVYEGPLTRAGKGEEYKRTHPNGYFHTNYNLLYRFAARFQNEDAQGVAAWMKRLKHINAEDFWSLIWYDPNLKEKPIQEQKRWHYFSDHGVVYWRTTWLPTATAFAFKAGPPEGHHTTPLIKRFADWHLSSGHAHPDANSFIIYANEKYLTGDSGYAGLPMTNQHNTVLVDGKGQANEGQGHDVFDDIPYDQLDQIRITQVKLEPDFAYVCGDATAAYQPALGVKTFKRHLLFIPTDGFIIWDELATEQPRTFTSLLHSDNGIEKIGEDSFNIVNGDARLLIKVISPEKAYINIVPNIVTGAGRPGSVDKGEKQQRGQVVEVSNSTPSNFTRFLMHLKVDDSVKKINSQVNAK